MDLLTKKVRRLTLNKLLPIVMAIVSVVTLLLLAGLVFYTYSLMLAVILALAIITIVSLAGLFILQVKNAGFRQVKQAHYYDAITQLPNRHYFYEYIDNILSEAKQDKPNLAVLLVGIDQFRNINDRYGYDCGDKVLKVVSSRLQETIGRQGLVVHFAGDEFLVVLTDVGQEQTEQVAATLVEQFQKPIEVGTNTLKLSVSIGIAMYPFYAKGKNTLLQYAHAALHQAKGEGRNNYQFFIKTLYEARKRDVSIEQELRFAIENNELSLNFQPIIALKDQTVVGVEVLVRWYNKELGHVPPNEFIQVAEASGLISEIDNWVLTTACRQFAEWQTTVGDINLCLSLNCSTVELQGHKVVPTLEKTIKETNVDPEKVIIEVTETAVMKRADQAIRTLERLKTLGVQIAVDDFGTGYSSFDYLRKLPISLIKIDKSFTQNMVDNQSDREIVQAIIKLSDTLNITTIAEGVETQQMVALLTDFGCTYGQGYYFAKPMDKAAIENYLKQKRSEGATQSSYE